MGNFLNCFKPKSDEYTSFINTNNDDLLLTNIQERLDEYNDKVSSLNYSITTLKSSYFNTVKDVRFELADLKKENIDITKKYSQLLNDYRALFINNKAQEEKIADLEQKLGEMDNEKMFLNKSIDITESSKYLDSNSNFA